MADWSKILSRGRVEDRRSIGPALGGLGLGGVVVALIFSFLTGSDPGAILSQLESLPVARQSIATEEFAGSDQYETFAATVLGSNNDMWRQLFAELDLSYTEPKLVLFRTATESACGLSTSQVGPHYCPLDQTIYLDETFFDELSRRFGAAGGDVAEAYVISHETAHHAQNLLGIMDEALSGRGSERARNDRSVRLELQADCFAGLWANSIKDQGVFEPGEVYEAMDAAAAVGDDRIQSRSTGYINPETWTHGSSEQRVKWFDRGYNEGSLTACNTFE